MDLGQHNNIVATVMSITTVKHQFTDDLKELLHYRFYHFALDSEYYENYKLGTDI